MSDRQTEAVIRWIRQDEVEVYRAFRLRALADAPEAFGDSYALAIARPDIFWHERVANTSAGIDTILMVATDAETDAWLGMTGCVIETPGEIPGDGEALVVSVWVAPEARRRRVARRLLDAIVAWARTRDVRTLRLWVTETNQRARDLYTGAGFTQTGTTQPLPSNPTHTELEMARSI